MKNILCVDDDLLLRLVLSASIGHPRERYHFLSAGSGREAVAILAERPVDFVLTDLIMDDMDGFQLIEYMREHHPDIPLAVMSGDSGDTTMKRLKELGVTRFFEKPFSMVRLLNTIAEITGAEEDAAETHHEQGMVPSEGTRTWG